jgi:Zn-finger nucleic acid-binding protein
MTRTEEAGIKAHVCGHCFGTWIAPSALIRRAKADVAREQSGNADTQLPQLQDLIEVVAESNSKAEARCPECEKMMEKRAFQKMIPVTVDRCYRCDKVWLDTGEYNLIRRLYLEMMLSTDEEVVRLRDRIGLAERLDRGRRPIADVSGVSGAGISGSDVAGITIEGLFGLLTH